MLVWLERMLNVGVDSMIVTLSRVLVISVAMFDDSGPNRLYAYALRETGSATDMWLAPHMRLAGVCFSYIS